jgi:hypothetical protein
MLVAICAALVPPFPFSPGASAGNEGREGWRGRIVCFGESGQQQVCGPTSSRLGLEISSGQVQRFLPRDPLAGMLRDSRVRAREVLVRGRLRPDGAVQLIKVFSIKDGILQDLSYFCDVCNITAYEPGPCPCCGKEMELREIPAS